LKLPGEKQSKKNKRIKKEEIKRLKGNKNIKSPEIIA